MRFFQNFFLVICLMVLVSNSSATAKAYKSAEIYTKDTHLYGKFVMRIRAAQGSGIISNFFLWKEGSEQSHVSWEEVDIEIFGKDDATAWQSNIITGLGSRITSENTHLSSSSLAEAYHTYSIEWTPDYIAWFIDGQQVRRAQSSQVNAISSATTARFNFWAPNIPGWVGPFSDSILPVYMFVNWIEYYSWDGAEFSLAWRDDFNHFDATRWSKAAHTFAENLNDFVPNNAVVKEGYLVLAMTHLGQEGFSGSPPNDDESNSGNDGNEGNNDNSQVQCAFQVTSEWQLGYVAEVTLINRSDHPVNAWQVQWQSNKASVENWWNTQLVGDNPYTAKPLVWNKTIPPGDRRSFGLQIKKRNAGEPAEIPRLGGISCE